MEQFSMRKLFKRKKTFLSYLSSYTKPALSVFKYTRKAAKEAVMAIQSGCPQTRESSLEELLRNVSQSPIFSDK